MAKNIVVFSDGTGQVGGAGYDTNVHRLFKMVLDRSPQQVAFYDRGLGTGFRYLGAATGLGISRNILECYRFIFDHYQSKDKVYLFGFSRGAFTVRSLSGFLNLFGILPSSRPELIREAYSIYSMDNRDRRREKAEDFKRRHHVMSCPIEVVGVWDTVGALGLPIPAMQALNPLKTEFHDTQMCSNVRYGFHALSIDDERKTFHPTLWNEHEKNADQVIEQVWFRGVHTDVGGGYPQRGLSDITLQWMLSQVVPLGLKLYDNHDITLSPNSHELINDSRSDWRQLFRREPRHLSDNELVLPPKVHVSAFERQDTSPWIFRHDPIQVGDRREAGATSRAHAQETSLPASQTTASRAAAAG